MIEVVRPERVDAMWSLLAEGMRKSCDRTGGELSAGYLWQECRAGHAFLVVAYDESAVLGAAIVRFETWPSGIRLRGLGLCGKNMKSWIEEMRAAVEQIARAGGAVAIVDKGSPGLMRLFRHLGIKSRLLSTQYEVRL